MPRAIISPTSCSRRSRTGNLQGLPGEATVGLEVLVTRARNDVWRQRRHGWLFVPANGFEVIAHELLVEAGLRTAGPVRIRRPIARRVRGHHLVDEKQLARLVHAELELGVGEDDAVRGGVRGAELVER